MKKDYNKFKNFWKELFTDGEVIHTLIYLSLLVIIIAAAFVIDDDKSYSKKNDPLKQNPNLDYALQERTFYNYKCTQNCAGHEAGWDWAEDKGINDVTECDGKSNSFIEGCETYVIENY